jgi:hypothetical protein
MNRIPTAHVSNGLSQKAARIALEGLQLVIPCHVKATIPAHATDVSKGGYHFLGQKWWLWAAERRPRIVRKTIKMVTSIKWEKNTIRNAVVLIGMLDSCICNHS